MLGERCSAFGVLCGVLLCFCSVAVLFHTRCSYGLGWFVQHLQPRFVDLVLHSVVVGDANINTSVEAMQAIAAVAEAGDQQAIRLLVFPVEDQCDLDFDSVMMASIKGFAKIGSGKVTI